MFLVQNVNILTYLNIYKNILFSTGFNTSSGKSDDDDKFLKWDESKF